MNADGNSILSEGKKGEVGMAVCSSKKFSNKGPILPNYELTIPTSLPLLLNFFESHTAIPIFPFYLE